MEQSLQPGENKCGMIVWRMEYFPPECPSGREVSPNPNNPQRRINPFKIIIIANDITFLSGSFAPEEDMTFYKASELARRLGNIAYCRLASHASAGIPRIYISANSGARIGLADEVKNAFRVCHPFFFFFGVFL